jgi:hypothetical protein
LGIRSLANIEDGENIRVIQRSRGAGFLLEATQTIGVGGKTDGQNLDGDVASEPRIARAIDFAHAARSDGGKDLVRSEAGAGR